MILSLCKKGGSALLMLLVLPVMTLAATPAAAPAPFAPSAKARMDTQWASHLLRRMKTNVAKVNNDAAQLQVGYREGLDWQADAARLNRLSARVKKIDGELYDLRTIRKDVPAKDSKVIAQLAPEVTILTDEVNSSIHFVNNDQESMWQPKWRTDTNELSQTSEAIQQDLRMARHQQVAS
jgi:hypothetical protein